MYTNWNYGREVDDVSKTTLFFNSLCLSSIIRVDVSYSEIIFNLCFHIWRVKNLISIKVGVYESDVTRTPYFVSFNAGLDEINETTSKNSKSKRNSKISDSESRMARQFSNNGSLHRWRFLMNLIQKKTISEIWICQFFIYEVIF